MGISNDSREWAWKKALGVHGWMHKWERNGWKSASGGRVRHADVWKRILKWLRLFESAPDRCVEVLHVKAHTGEVGNERADKLAKKGAELRFKLMGESAGDPTWFKRSLETYWGNRNPI